MAGEVLILWHSRTGLAAAMAQAALAGARTVAPAQMLQASAAAPEDLHQAGAYLFVFPENLGSLSGVAKDLFDRCYYPLLGRIEGRAYATLIAAGTAGQGAEAQLDRIVTGWRLRRVAAGVIVRSGADRPETILGPKTLSATDTKSCHELGQALASGLEMGIF